MRDHCCICEDGTRHFDGEPWYPPIGRGIVHAKEARKAAADAQVEKTSVTDAVAAQVEKTFVTDAVAAQPEKTSVTDTVATQLEKTSVTDTPAADGKATA